jgi:hypothetical protein
MHYQVVAIVREINPETLEATDAPEQELAAFSTQEEAETYIQAIAPDRETL